MTDNKEVMSYDPAESPMPQETSLGAVKVASFRRAAGNARSLAPIEIQASVCFCK